jgi:hypothetical protein
MRNRNRARVWKRGENQAQGRGIRVTTVPNTIAAHEVRRDALENLS